MKNHRWANLHGTVGWFCALMAQTAYMKTMQSLGFENTPGRIVTLVCILMSLVISMVFLGIGDE